MVTSKNLILTFISFLFLSQLSLAAVKKNPDMTAEKLQKEQLAFNEENMKLTLKNIEKLRAMSVKNSDIIYDQMTKNQKALTELRKNNILKNENGNGNFVILKGNELQLEVAQLRLKLNKQLSDEGAKFQETMRQRRVQMAAKVTKSVKAKL